MDNQDKLSSSNVQFKDKRENLEAEKNERMEKTVTTNPRCWCSRVHRIVRPLRVVELLILVALFALAIYLAVRKDRESLTDIASVLLITLFSIYLLILGVDLTSQIIWRTLPDTPMFVFVVLGFLLFIAAAEGIYVFLFLNNTSFLLLGIMILCIIVAGLFLVDVALIILNWRQACMMIDKCPFDDPATSVKADIYKPGENYPQRIAVGTSDPLLIRSGYIENVPIIIEQDSNLRDVTTSISDYDRMSHPDLANLHKWRKVGVSHRREYINRSVDAPSLVQAKMMQVQTEPPKKKTVSDVETLIIADVKEEPAQTAPKCPVCANHWDRQRIRRTDNFGLCPTFLQLTQGYGGCNCCPANLPAPEANCVELCSESTSAMNLVTLSRTNQKPSSRKNSEERK